MCETVAAKRIDVRRHRAEGTLMRKVISCASPSISTPAVEMECCLTRKGLLMTVNAAEPFADAPYDASTLASMIEAYAASCQELEFTNGWARFDYSNGVRLKLAVRILKAAAAGERDPDRIMLLALRAVI